MTFSLMEKRSRKVKTFVFSFVNFSDQLAGTIVSWIAWNLGRNPKHFGEPLKFHPERWLSKEENGGLPVPSQTYTSPPHIPFQMNPRLCL